MEIEKYYDIIVEKLIGWSEQIVKLLPNFILAILVLIAFVFVGKIIKKLAQQLLDRTFKNRSLSSITAKIIYIYWCICSVAFIES